MSRKRVTKELIQMLEILSEHYDYGVSDDCPEMKEAYQKRQKAQSEFEPLFAQMDKQKQEAVSNLIGAYDDEGRMMSICAYLHGLKNGMLFSNWVYAKDTPIFAEPMGMNDYLENISNLQSDHQTGDHIKFTRLK